MSNGSCQISSGHKDNYSSSPDIGKHGLTERAFTAETDIQYLALNELDSIEGTTWLPAGGVSPRHRSLSGLSYSGDVHK